MAALTSKKRLLVVGYVREINQLLKQKYVIPLSIIEICYKHYLRIHDTKHFVINIKANIKYSFNDLIHGRRIIEIDFKHKKSKIIGGNKYSIILETFCHYSAFCY
eukprot:41688_1